MWTVINEHEWAKLQGRHPKEVFGEGNVAPANFREVTDEEFTHAHYYTGYSYVAIGYSQITRLNDGTELPDRVHGNLYINSFGKGWLMEIRHWQNKVVFWLFDLCQHEYETTKTAKCYWEGKCKKCGHLHAVDSSD